MWNRYLSNVLLNNTAYPDVLSCWRKNLWNKRVCFPYFVTGQYIQLSSFSWFSHDKFTSHSSHSKCSSWHFATQKVSVVNFGVMFFRPSWLANIHTKYQAITKKNINNGRENCFLWKQIRHMSQQPVSVIVLIHDSVGSNH